jgi:hypothetical protein
MKSDGGIFHLLSLIQMNDNFSGDIMNTNRLLIVKISTLTMLVLGVLAPHIPSTTVQAGPAPKPSSSVAIYVTSTIYDTDANGNPYLTRSDDYNGLGQASYSTLKGSKPAGNLVTSQITADGQWNLALSENSGRTVYITPNVPIGVQPGNVPPAGYYVIQKVYSICRDLAGNAIHYTSLTSGGSDCSMAINFFFNGTLYKLLMRPGALDGTTCPTGGCPETGRAKVSCNTVTSGKCTNWTLEPNEGAANVEVANLYSYTGGQSGPWVYIGQYRNTFRVNISNP